VDGVGPKLVDGVGPNDPDQNNVGVAVDAQQAADQAAEMVVVDEHSGTPVAGVAGGPDVVDQLDTDPAGGGANCCPLSKQ
jgi:hypothetical protein